MCRNGTHKRRGFTLIEVLMVIVILGMLSAVGVVSYYGIQESAKVDTTKRLLERVATALDAYRLKLGEFPTDEQGLQALLKKPEYENESMGKNWAGPYLKEEPKDAWGEHLVYQRVEDTGEEEGPALGYKLFSKGKDKQEDTEDDIVYGQKDDEEGSSE